MTIDILFTSKLWILLFLLIVVCAGISLIVPLMWPRIITYPWKQLPLRGGRKRKQTVILAGSYNPPHNGHLAMLEYLGQR